MMNKEIKTKKLKINLLKECEERELLTSISPEVRFEAVKIISGKKGLMPVTSNTIEIVWVHPCGFGRKAVLTVNAEGRKEFELVEKYISKRFKEFKECEE